MNFLARGSPARPVLRVFANRPLEVRSAYTDPKSKDVIRCQNYSMQVDYKNQHD